MSNDDAQQNPTDGILQDLENLRANSGNAEQHEVDDRTQEWLDNIADAANRDDPANRDTDAAQAPANTDEPTNEQPNDRQPQFDAYNPFSFGAPAPVHPVAPARPPERPTTASAGLLFQTPDVQLGQVADPDWVADDSHDDRDSHNDRDSRDDHNGSADAHGEGSDRGRSTADGDDSKDGADGNDNADGSDGDSGQGGKKRRRGGRGRRSKRDRSDNGDTGGDAQQDGSQHDGANHAESEEQGGTSGHSEHSEPGEGDHGSGHKDHDAKGAEGKRDKKSKDSKSVADDGDEPESGSSRRRRRSRDRASAARDEVTGVKGSTRLEAKRQRRQEGRAAGRRRPLLTEAEFLARRESVERTMLVRSKEGRTQLVILEDGIAVEHYLSEDRAQASLIGNVYLGKVQNVLPSMEAAFVDIGKGRNAVLYAGEVNWDALGMDGKPRRIEVALNPGDPVLVQVTKDPIGHKGARLTSQISLPGRYLVFVPGNTMTGISRKLPDNERQRLKKLLKEILPDGSGVIVRTAAEGAAEAELTHDVERLTKRWNSIESKTKSTKVQAPKLLYSEPDMTLRIIRDVFNEDFKALVVEGGKVYDEIHEYVESVAPDLLERVHEHDAEDDIFTHYRVDEQIEKALNRVVHLPSGGSLVIDRTEAMTVIDVNTGKFTGSGGNLEETVTKNNLEAAEEVIRQLRLRDIGGIIVVDFIDMVLESNRDLVVRRLVECLSRDRTKHQVAEVTSLGLVQMTRKRIGTGLAEGLAAAGEDMTGRGLMLPGTEPDPNAKKYRSRKSKDKDHNGGQNGGRKDRSKTESNADKAEEERQRASRSAVAAIAKATLNKDDEAVAASTDTSASAGDEQGEARKSAKKKRKRKQAAAAGPEAAGVSETAPAPVSEPEPAPEPAPEPTGPAPLMIGGDTATRVQTAAQAAPAPTVATEAGAEAQSAADTEPALGSTDAEVTESGTGAKASAESTQPAPPILIIGQE